MLKERDIEIDLTSPPRNDSSNNQIKEVESFRETESKRNISSNSKQTQPSQLPFFGLQPPSQQSKFSQPQSSQNNASLLSASKADPSSSSQPQDPKQSDSNPKRKKSKSKRNQVMESFMKSTNSLKKEIDQKDKSEKQEEKKYFGLF